MEQACKVQHPMSPSLALPEFLAEAISFTTQQGFHQVAKRRVEFFKLWNNRAMELEKAEADLRREMDPLVEKAVRGKKLKLFGEMLDYYKYPDPGVVDELRVGADLTGDVKETGMLPFKFTPAVLTCDALRIQSELRRKRLMEDAKGSGDKAVDKEVWRQMLEECNQGCPIDESEVPFEAPISRLEQRHKIRLIDDFSESSVNSTVSVFETPTLHTVDVACAALVHWFSCAKASKVDASRLARTFDLSSANRQVALNQQGREVSYIRVFNPSTGRWCLFQALVLPFGAIKSVHAFLRLARAIWWLGVGSCWMLLVLVLLL